MKKLLMLVFSASACWAQYTISSCGMPPITMPGTYTIASGGLTTSSTSTPCITVAVTTGTGTVTIEGNYQTLTNTATSPAPAPLVSVASVIQVVLQHTGLKFSGFSEFSGHNLVSVSGTGSGTKGGYGFTSVRNTYSNGTLFITGSNNYISYLDVLNQSALQSDTSSWALVEFDTVDLTNSTVTTSCGICIADAVGAVVQYNGIAGNPAKQDDGITLEGDNATNIQVNWNGVYGVWDCGIEFLGHMNGGKIFSNIMANIGQYAVCGYHGYGATNLEIQGLNIQNNILMGGQSGSLFGFYPADGSSGSMFYNNLLSGNIMVNRASGAQTVFGTSTFPFATTGLNVIQNNNFTDHGLAAISTYFYPSTGYTDGGTNYCYSNFPSAGNPITCH
jgi:hypothetical protein